MKMIQLLDCTLREAPIDNLQWGDYYIYRMIDGLEKANIDIIEVGFLKNDIHIPGSTSFKRAEEIEMYLDKKDNILYAALVDYGKYDLSNLIDYNGKSVDVIRVCFKHHEINHVIDYVKQIKDKGYKVCIQHVDTMGYSDEEIIRFIGAVNEVEPMVYSIVDTFGAMYSSDAKHYYEIVSERLKPSIALGFHAHNNLMLADANSQRFVEECCCRDIVVDSSVYGCGRSAGNAHTELMAQFLNKRFDVRYDIDEILDIIDAVIPTVQEKTNWGYSIPYFIAGMHNSHTFNVKRLLKRHNLKSKDLRGIIELLGEKQKKEYDYALLEKLYVQYFDKTIDDSATIAELTDVFACRNVVLLAPGKTVQIERTRVMNYIEDNNSLVIGVNNLIDCYKLDYAFFSGANRYRNLQYQDYKKAGSPVLIVASNIKTESDDKELIVNYSSLIKSGWVNLDSSIILLLRLLAKCKVNKISIAGLDGFSTTEENYYSDQLDTGLDDETKCELTRDVISMFKDFVSQEKNISINFLTESVYAEAIK